MSGNTISFISFFDYLIFFLSGDNLRETIQESAAICLPASNLFASKSAMKREWAGFHKYEYRQHASTSKSMCGRGIPREYANLQAISYGSPASSHNGHKDACRRPDLFLLAVHANIVGR